DVVVVDETIGVLGDPLVADPLVGTALELMERDILLPGRGVQPDRDVHQAEAELTTPDRARHERRIPRTTSDMRAHLDHRRFRPEVEPGRGGYRRPVPERGGQKHGGHGRGLPVAAPSAWGVSEVFGYPGDGINGLIAAFEKAGDRPKFVQSRHEEMSAFQAVGYAKFSGRCGVCLATSGPGAIHLLNGLYDAKLDHVPVVAIVGQTARSAMGGSYQQEVDLQALFKDVAGEYLVEVNVSQQLPNALDRAIRTAESKRAPTALIIPSD